jgi:predicted lipid-binding transport protein (Tim44 family)
LHNAAIFLLRAEFRMKNILIAIALILALPYAGMAQPDSNQADGVGFIGKLSYEIENPERWRASPAAGYQTVSETRAASQSAAAREPAATGSAGWSRHLDDALEAIGVRAWLAALGIPLAFALLLVPILLLLGMAMAVRLRHRDGEYAQFPREPVLASDEEADASSLQRTSDPVRRQAQWGIPPDFDVPDFLLHAKTCFTRLLAAWDNADAEELRQITSPGIFVEFERQLQDRGGATGHTEVALLNASLLGIQRSEQESVASVKFSGMIRTFSEEPAAPFIEVWNLAMPAAGGREWTVAGIQQLQ